MSLHLKYSAFFILCVPAFCWANPTSANLREKAAVVGIPGEVTYQFQLRDKTQIPGRTLKPGVYTIRIVDHLNDRMILRVDHDGKIDATFLALPSNGLQAAGQGPISLNAGATAKNAMRGFAFSNGTVAEFVYPKSEAVGLAKANRIKIAAIDPESEGRSENINKLSQDDLQMVTLWMLSPTTVGPDEKPAVLAERYHAPQVTGTEVAGAPTTRSAPVVNVSRSGSLSAPSVEPQTASAQVPARPVRKMKPVMTVLPHTAGSMPLVWLIAGLSLLGAAVLSGCRLIASGNGVA